MCSSDLGGTEVALRELRGSLGRGECAGPALSLCPRPGVLGRTHQSCQLGERPRRAPWDVRHKPGGRRQPPALAHPLVRAVSAPPITGIPSVALWSSVAFRVMLDVKGSKRKKASVQPWISGPLGQQVNNDKDDNSDRSPCRPETVPAGVLYAVWGHTGPFSWHNTAAPPMSAQGLGRSSAHGAQDQIRFSLIRRQRFRHQWTEACWG